MEGVVLPQERMDQSIRTSPENKEKKLKKRSGEKKEKREGEEWRQEEEEEECMGRKTRPVHWVINEMSNYLLH